MKFTILVIDGQGGNLGCQLIKLMKEQLPDAEIDHGNPSKLLRIHHSKGSVA